MEKPFQFLKKRILVFVFLYSIIGYSQSTATYDFTFTSIWNATDHTSIPSGAHWSDLVGATHNTTNEFLALGINATLGIKNVAELGNNTAFNNEVDLAIIATNANQWFEQGFSPFAAISSATLSGIEVTEVHHFLTLVSMIAPSPDWFIAVNSVDLRSGNNGINNGWKDTFTIDVFAYDAGTDDGVNYSSLDSPNTPVGISMISGFPINGNKMGALTATLKSVVLNVDDTLLKEVKIFPNPSSGNITISNIKNQNIKSFEIYNTLGKLINDFHLEERKNIINLNLETLGNGIYFLKLITANGEIKTKKLVIK